jgi:hypothetical protein
MMAKTLGSRSMNIAPVSSRKLEIRPLNKAVKKESGTQVNVCREVENLKIKFYFIHIYFKNLLLKTFLL